MSTPEECQRIQRLLEEMGGVQEIIDDLEQFNKGSQLVSEQWRTLLKQYPDKWIAFFKGEVIASADSLQELLSSISEKNRSSTICKFMATDPKPLLLIAAQHFYTKGLVSYARSFIFTQQGTWTYHDHNRPGRGSTIIVE